MVADKLNNLFSKLTQVIAHWQSIEALLENAYTKYLTMEHVPTIKLHSGLNVKKNPNRLPSLELLIYNNQNLQIISMTISVKCDQTSS